jgi:hypothetical protein
LRIELLIRLHHRLARTFDVEKLQRTHELLSMGWSPSAIAAEVQIPRTSVYRIKQDPAKMEAILRTWSIS